MFFTFNRKSIASSNFSLAQVPTGGGGVALSPPTPLSLSLTTRGHTRVSHTAIIFINAIFFQFIYWIMDLVVSFTWGRKGVSLCGSDLHDLCDLLTSSTAAHPHRHLHHPHYCCYHTIPHHSQFVYFVFSLIHCSYTTTTTDRCGSRRWTEPTTSSYYSYSSPSTSSSDSSSTSSWPPPEDLMPLAFAIFCLPV